MPFTVNDFEDLFRILAQEPTWLARLRSVVLSGELLALPDLVRELADAQRRTEDALTQLTGAVRQLVIEVGQLQGDAVEARYRRRATSYFGDIIRRTHVLSDDECWALFEPAMEQGLLSRAEVRDLALADVLVRGRRWGDHQEVYLVVESSRTIGNEDVNRASRRASLLARTGVDAIPVVAGEAIAEIVAERARSEGVWQVTDGQVVPPGPDPDDGDARDQPAG